MIPGPGLASVLLHRLQTRDSRDPRVAAPSVTLSHIRHQSEAAVDLELAARTNLCQRRSDGLTCQHGVPMSSQYMVHLQENVLQ
jgi:hypothetical protein